MSTALGRVVNRRGVTTRMGRYWHNRRAQLSDCPGPEVDRSPSSYTSRVDAHRKPDLLEIREAINALDAHIVKLIGERQAWVEQAGEIKRDQGKDAVRAPARVDAVISRVRSLATPAGASPDVVERTYRALIASFIDLELEVHGRESTDH